MLSRSCMQGYCSLFPLGHTLWDQTRVERGLGLALHILSSGQYRENLVGSEVLTGVIYSLGYNSAYCSENQTTHSTKYYLHMLLTCLSYSSTMKMYAICCSEASVNFHRTTRCRIQGDRFFSPLRQLLYYKTDLGKKILWCVSQHSWQKCAWQR
jgi:hypothetical protein